MHLKLSTDYSVSTYEGRVLGIPVGISDSSEEGTSLGSADGTADGS